MRKVIFSLFFLLFFSPVTWALTFRLPASDDSVVGQVQWVHALPGDDFTQLGRRYDIGYYQLVEANPGIDPRLPVSGTLVIIPGRFVLPDVPHKGIVINLPELRIYYFPKDGRHVITYPVGIGREGWNTPIGVTAILAKVTDPTWVAPESIRKWRAKEGVVVPKVVPPGPDNPLGGYAIYLGFSGYRIHGTNEPTGIGRRSSSGCIRLWPEDIEELFELVDKTVPVRVINDPYKAGWLNNTLYLESHTPLQEQEALYEKSLAPLRYDIRAVVGLKKNQKAEIDWGKATQVAAQQNGIPQIIGHAEY